MSSNMHIRPEQFEAAMKKAMLEYGDHVYDVVESSSKNAARQTVSDLKGSAPSGGEYGRGWSHKKQGNGRTAFAETVYNRLYQLTHLLEKPHSTGGGGHYPSQGGPNYTGNIARAEEANANRYMEEVMSKL